MPRLLLLMFLTAAVLTATGCQCCRQPVATRTTVVPPGTACPPPGGVVLPPPPAPIGAPPPGFVPGPGAPSIGPPPAGPPTVRQFAPGSASLSPPRFEPNWLPADAREAASKSVLNDPLLGPTGTTPAPSGPRLYPPENSDKNTGEPPLLDEKAKPSVFPSGAPKQAKTPFPVGIPQFAPATNGVWAGLRPSIDDGLDWLAANEYRTVVHLRAPGEPENADRKQVEKLGMTYVSLEISPQSLSRAKLDEFAKLVGDVARRPLFVYDQDGSLAGPLWYLYFRKAGDDDDLARIKANPLGLRADRDGPHRLMWLAVQQYLEANP
jgi:protein tyrosine phosphatase (PTP) superfamily phosphohydrolase (DUF442 family)